MLRILFALRRESRIGRIAQPTLRGGATRRTARRRRPRSRDHALARSHSPWYDQRPCWVRVVVQETAAGGRFDEPLDMTAPEVSSVTPDAGPALGPMEPKEGGVPISGDGGAGALEEAGTSALADEDGDGMSDDIDSCPGFDEREDGDGDTIADGCDRCPRGVNPQVPSGRWNEAWNTRMPLNIDEVIAGPLSAALAIRRLALHPLLGVTRWG